MKVNLFRSINNVLLSSDNNNNKKNNEDEDCICCLKNINNNQKNNNKQKTRQRQRRLRRRRHRVITASSDNNSEVESVLTEVETFFEEEDDDNYDDNSSLSSSSSLSSGASSCLRNIDNKKNNNSKGQRQRQRHRQRQPRARRHKVITASTDNNSEVESVLTQVKTFFEDDNVDDNSNYSLSLFPVSSSPSSSSPSTYCKQVLSSSDADITKPTNYSTTNIALYQPMIHYRGCCVEKKGKSLRSEKTNGSYNGWSDPEYNVFSIRGTNYLLDGQKIQNSSPYIFPSRGVELFLTTNLSRTTGISPQNVANNNPNLLCGRLREVPTFLINFRLPFGVFILYYEIPKRFIPVIEAKYNNKIEHHNHQQQQEKQKNMKLIEETGSSRSSDKAIYRFFMGDDHHRNATLKFIPRIVDGPWIVKTAVPTKPTIIGNKLPISYHYGPSSIEKNTKEELYFEVDIDIAGGSGSESSPSASLSSSSSTARTILNVVQSYTKSLTLDLGFVIQGNFNDELPEQMLCATRLHQIDTTTAPQFPTISSPSATGGACSDE